MPTGAALDRPLPAAEPEDAWLAPAFDDVTPVLASLAPATPFALATLVAAEGGPRPPGAQMVVTADRRWGFLSGGCVEGDIATHARAALEDGRPRRLAYGRDSPFWDIRLPCGGRIELLVEPVPPGDPAIARLLSLRARRRPARYLSDGERRLCVERGDAAGAGSPGTWIVDRAVLPAQRLLVVGHDPFATAIAMAGWQQGWATVLLAPGPPPGRPPEGLPVLAGPPGPALTKLRPDAWTAVAVATHDGEDDEAALAAALVSEAGYVGALGSRRRLAARRQRLLDAGVPEAALERLRAPIGLPIGARSPREVAAAAIAEIIALRARVDAPAGP